MRKLVYLIVGSFFVVGCATPPHYGPRVNGSFGYSDHDFADGRVMVTFVGDTNSGKDAVVKYWLYRCADMAVERGFRYFALLPESPAKSGSLPGSLDPPTDGVSAFKARSAPIITIMVTGGGVETTWSKWGFVRFSHTRVHLLGEQVHSLHAPTVLKMLKPMVESNRNEGPPDVRDVIDAAMHAGDPG
ncbi:MAG: hypothetical protein K0S48_976 [Ramlibacter sp.]|nr:hypothetical protein [Ramlibacter sp.]